MDIIMPQLGETVSEGTVSEWFKKPGDTIEIDEAILEVETDKVTTEVPAIVAGTLTEILVPEGETVAVGTRLAIIQSAGDEPAPTPDAEQAPTVTETAPPPATEQAPKMAARSSRGEIRLSPVVRRLLAEHGIDAGDVAGSGDGGRITRKDVLTHIEANKAGGAAGTTRIPFSQTRKRIAEHMVRSKATSPHVLQAVEVDFHAVDQIRAAHGEQWKEQRGYSLTYLPFIARAVCLSIPEFPNINAHVEGDSLIVHDRINLGIAIDLNLEGLVAPVVKDAGRMSLAELAEAIRDLATRARKGDLRPDDMTEGTYSISNSGSFGTLITAPIINQPQVAILSSDGVAKKPVVVEGPDGDEIAIHPVGVVAQSFDHRAIDGAYSAAYLRELKQVIESHDWDGEFE